MWAVRVLRGTRFQFLVFQRRAYEGREQRVRFQRLGFEFRMELAAKKPRMVGRLDDLDVILVGRAPGDAQTRACQDFS